MRKICLIALIAVIASSLLGAAAVPIQNFRDQEEWVKHPGLLPVIEESTTFDISADFGNSIDDGFRFLSDPVGTLQEAAVAFGDAIVSMDDAEILENYQSLSESFTFDPGFPGRGNTDEETVYFVREYFRDGGRFDSLDPANRARGVASALRNGLAPYSGNILPGAMYIDLRMRGGEVHSGFGWDWNVDFFFNGSQSLLVQPMRPDHRYGNEFGVTFGGDVGYGAFVLDDRLALGIAASPQMFFRTSFLNADYIEGRLTGNPLMLLASNVFYLGIGIDVNAGLLYRIDDNLSFAFDLRHIPSLQTAWYFTADDLLQAFSFHHDGILYYEPFDAAATLFMDYGKINASVEISNIVSEAIWMAAVPGWTMDYWSFVSLGFGYSFTDDLTLYAKYEKRTLAIGVEYMGFTAELSSRLDIAAFGIKAGYAF